MRLIRGHSHVEVSRTVRDVAIEAVPVCVESSSTLSPPKAKTDDWMEIMLVRCVSTSSLTGGRSLVGCDSGELTRSLLEWLTSGLVGAVSTKRDGSLVLEPG